MQTAADDPHADHALPPLRSPVRAATVLIALADGLTRTLLATHLAERGFEVVTAGNGREAMHASRRRRIDAVVVDADVGEARLRAAVRADLWLAEAKVVALPGRRNAGIDDGSAGVVVRALGEALARRVGVLEALGTGAWGPLSDVGVQCLLDGACAAGVRGRLSVDDSITSWRVDFADGLIVDATARAVLTGNERDGIDALVALVADGGDAPYVFEPHAVGQHAPPVLGSWGALAHVVLDGVDALRRGRARH